MISIRSLKTTFLITLGIILVITSGYDLYNYYSGAPIEYISTRFGTFTGKSAVTIQISYLAGGIILFIWGVLGFKSKET